MLNCRCSFGGHPANRCDGVETVLQRRTAGDRRAVERQWMRPMAQTRHALPRDEQLPEPRIHSEGFRQTRKARSGALVEDYVELIADLIENDNEARQVDIAAHLGVSQPTVAKMLARLAAEGLVTRKLYRGVFLTEAGRTVAEQSRERHQIVEAFLRSLGVSHETARIDAEGIEHHVSSETLEAFRKAMRV